MVFDIPLPIVYLFSIFAVVFFFVSLIIGRNRDTQAISIVIGFIGGMVWVVAWALADNVTMGYAPVSPFLTNSNTTQILSNTTVYDVSQYYTVTNMYAGHTPFNGEYFNSSSIGVGKTFSCITIPLKKVGSPSGVIYFGVLDSTNKGTMKKIIGSMDVGALTTGYKPITQCAGAVGLNNAFLGSGFDKYTIVAGDKVGIFYNDGNSTNYLVTGLSRYKDFDTSGDPTCATHKYSINVSLSDVNAIPFYFWGGCVDLTMQLINTNSYSNTVNAWNTTAIPINFPLIGNSVTGAGSQDVYFKILMIFIGLTMVVVAVFQQRFR